jgi:hypothetical protein
MAGEPFSSISVWLMPLWIATSPLPLSYPEERGVRLPFPHVGDKRSAGGGLVADCKGAKNLVLLG